MVTDLFFSKKYLKYMAIAIQVNEADQTLRLLKCFKLGVSLTHLGQLITERLMHIHCRLVTEVLMLIDCKWCPVGLMLMPCWCKTARQICVLEGLKRFGIDTRN